MLTVFRKNEAALNFYYGMKYLIDDSSPSACGEEAPHEILSKFVNALANTVARARAEVLYDSD